MSRTEVFEAGLSDRGANIVEFTTLALRYLRDAIVEAGPAASDGDALAQQQIASVGSIAEHAGDGVHLIAMRTDDGRHAQGTSAGGILTQIIAK